MENKSFEQIFGYSPIDEFQQLGTWQTNRRDALAPLVDAQIGYYSQMATNKANQQLADTQNQFNLDMWNKQNDYNSPKATMERLVSAGINPRAYQQIGQFANASQPHAAERPDYESPLGKLAKFTEKAQIDLAIKRQRLQSITLAKDIAKETADKIHAYRELDETKRHNLSSESLSQARVAETERHNQATEAISNVALMMKDNEWRLALQRAGIVQHDDGTFTIPSGDIRLEERYRNKMLEVLEQKGLKFETERDYLEQKKTLESINTGVKWVDSLAKLIAAIL